jgi:hypothetical protein
VRLIDMVSYGREHDDDDDGGDGAAAAMLGVV